jgi:hypothetical protein
MRLQMDMKMFSTLRMKMTSEQDCQYGRKIKVLLDRRGFDEQIIRLLKWPHQLGKG